MRGSALTFLVIFIGIGGLILLIFGKIFHARAKKGVKVIPIQRSPLKSAIFELIKIKKSISKETYDGVSMMLSSTLRSFLGKIFRYIRPEMTNTEIINALNRDPGNDWQTISLVTEVLSLTERVNFAKKQLSVPQQLGLYKKTGTVILKIWKERREKYGNR